MQGIVDRSVDGTGEYEKEETGMNIELSRKDLRLLDVTLEKELDETKVEIRHADNMDYKNCLKDREKAIVSLQQRVAVGLKEASKEDVPS